MDATSRTGGVHRRLARADRGCPVAPMRRYSIVRQEHTHGCAVASAAMVLGQTYAATLAELVAMGSTLDLDKGGLTSSAIERLLAVHGYVWRKIYRAWWPPEQWPPEPFAPVHIASVIQPSGRSHFVVMLADGQVLDPVGQGASLNYWPEVQNVTGVWREPGRGGGGARWLL